MDLREFQKRRDEVEQARRKADRLAGTLDQFHKQLKDEFGCSSKEEGVEHLTIMEKKAKEQEAEVEKEWKEWTKKWEGKL